MSRFWGVSYYYLATGMEGQADKRYYGIVEADSAQAAIDLIAESQSMYFRNESEKQFFRGCLSAGEVAFPCA